MTDATTCTKCPTGASTCTSATVATACSDGYYSALPSCVACRTGVATCTSTADSTCSAGYSLVSAACI